MTPEALESLLLRAGLREVTEPELVGWEPITKGVKPEDETPVLETTLEYQRLKAGGKQVALVRMQDGKITIWERTDRADIWKQH